MYWIRSEYYKIIIYTKVFRFLITTNVYLLNFQCDCAKEDYLCMRSKQRVEICRSSVTMAMNRTRVSCRIATWICNADALCSKALDYYNGFCKSMFHGRKCTPRWVRTNFASINYLLFFLFQTLSYTGIIIVANTVHIFYFFRCRNSIAILTRQEKAAKLNTCICDGAEEYDCKGIHRNMNVLCFGKVHHDYHDVKKLLADTRTNEIKGSGESSKGSGFRFLVNRTTMVFTLILLLLTLEGKYWRAPTNFTVNNDEHFFFKKL